MCVRKYLLLLLYFFLSFSVFSQGFIALDWEHPSPAYEGFEVVSTDMPGFAGAFYVGEPYLPFYICTKEIGKNYCPNGYEAVIEYPEFAPLTRKQVMALEKAGVQLPEYPTAKVNMSVTAGEGLISVSFVPLVYKDGAYQKIKSFKLSLRELVRPLRAGKARIRTMEKGYVANSVLNEGRWVKIRIKDTGVYQITNAELAGMGFSDPSKVRLYGFGGRILSENLCDYAEDDLQEIPLWRESGSVLFYGYGTVRWEEEKGLFVHTQNHYSTYGCYFLTESDEPPMAFPQIPSVDSSDALIVNTFPDYALHEKDAYAWMEGGRRLFDDYDYRNGNTQSYTFDGLTGITDDNGTVTVSFSANSMSAATTVEASVNGQELSGDLIVSTPGSTYAVASAAEKNFAWRGTKNERSIVTLKHVRSSDVSGRLDYIRLNYTRRLALYGSATSFRSLEDGNVTFSIDGADENTCVWRVSGSEGYGQMMGDLSGNTYSFSCNNEMHDEYVVVNPKGRFNAVEVVGEIPNQNLHALADVDMVIITTPNADFIKQAQRLADAHEEHDGLKSAVVTSEQVYNEFSSGTPDATAYRRFMRMLYDKEEEGQGIKYLLLFGDCSYDNRLLTSAWSVYSQDDFLLTFESKNSFSSTDSYMFDDYFGIMKDSINTDDVLYNYPVDLGVGRIPVRTNIEAKNVVDMLIAYMNNEEVGPWKNTVAFLGDDGKNNRSASSPEGNIHMEQADALAGRAVECNPSLLVKKVHWDAYKMEVSATGDAYPAVEEQVQNLFRNGMLFFNYTGHGSASAISDEYVITTASIDKLVTSKRPFWFTAACDITPVDRNATSIGEMAFLKGAAIGLMSTARTVFPYANCRMDSVFIRHLFTKTDEGYLRLGDVVRKTRTHLSLTGPSTNNLQFVFIGDPALRLSIPDYRVVVDEFNGQVVEGVDDLPLIKAGGIVTVKGHVEDADGNPVPGFFGTVYPTVLDSEEKVVTYNNNGLAPEPFEYYDRTNTIYSGSDSIRAGSFEFQFPVPMDINYSDEEGLLNLYAVNADHTVEGQGNFTGFLVGQTEDGAMDTDSVGPKITLYLNTPDFVDGARVNPSPYLIAELEDEDGINATGSGIGHDIIAMIDNSPMYTYVLNDYYTPVFGDYTRGTVRYNLPALPEGKHQLLFRAWDIKNNSSTQIVDFEVVDGLVVSLDITCTNSPATDHTMFILTHDRPYAEVDVTISVYDYAGRVLWTHQESGMAEGNYYYVDWDLKTNSGQPLVPGIYLYRATISSGGSKESTQSRKIVVVGQ